MDMAETIDVMVEKPPHYQGRFEVIDIIERYGFVSSWHLADALKYLLRYGKKGGPDDWRRDLGKALYYLRRWVDDPFGASTWPDISEDEIAGGGLPMPQDIIADKGLTGNVAIAATYLLTMALDGEDSDAAVEKAIAALEAEFAS